MINGVIVTSNRSSKNYPRTVKHLFLRAPFSAWPVPETKFALDKIKLPNAVGVLAIARMHIAVLVFIFKASTYAYFFRNDGLQP
jgi:hypothetical protein